MGEPFILGRHQQRPQNLNAVCLTGVTQLEQPKTMELAVQYLTMLVDHFSSHTQTLQTVHQAIETRQWH
jgi:hypothetical protein